MYFHKIHSSSFRKNDKNNDKVNDISTESDDIDFNQKNNNFRSSHKN